MIVGFGITLGLLLVAVIDVIACPVSPRPVLMPVRLIVCCPAFSWITGLVTVIGSSVGGWLIGVMVTLKVCVRVSMPLLAVPPLSIMLKVIVTVPLAFCCRSEVSRRTCYWRQCS